MSSPDNDANFALNKKLILHKHHNYEEDDNDDGGMLRLKVIWPIEQHPRKGSRQSSVTFQ